MKTAYIGIGTNLGDKLNNIKSAINALAHLPGTEVTKVSDVYETEPWGYTQQDEFLNVCAEVRTEFSPTALLGACLGIEAAYGRERPFKNSPRILDVDLLMFEDITMNSQELNLPHPLMQERAFVLVPLKDILENLEFNNINYTEFYEKCDKSGVKKVFLKDSDNVFRLL